ncbi:hypothetical protein GH714_004112 [Hevea brasiliensis]|uniref:R13L1/DRL21-like LRR repeat region domain-containing protein n=1 Tax=Hevea brasiliensis TaxID=3981 RepID=A0A6A6L1W2_HEVBR|nr:hypothetical protein GH714_004112 [Hevea brasiliensis]
MEKLSIIGYTGTKFPSWVVEFSFQNLVFLRLEDCKNCISLPQLGQLRSLKHLLVNGLAGVKRVDLEFLGDISVGNLPSHVSSLQKLVIRECPQLIVSLPKIVFVLKIERCKKVDCRYLVDLRSLSSVRLTVAAGEDGELLQWLNGSELEFLELRGCINLKKLAKWLHSIKSFRN